MALYAVTYDPTGRPTGILADSGATIPVDRGNSAFQQFLAWNAQQQPPLDYTSLGPTVSLTLDQKLDQMTSIAKTLAAVVEVLVAQYGANPPAGTPAWATSQLTAAHQFIKNQGG